MPSFKGTARERISTPDSVRRLVDLIARKAVEAPSRVQHVRDEDIDYHILQNQEVVKALLYDRYGGIAALKESTPWWNPPLSLLQNQDASNRLVGIGLGSSPITEQWVIECTLTDTSYSVTGQISGLQSAAGDFGVDYTSDAGDITIAAANWSVDPNNGIGEGDQFIVSVYWYNPLIVMIVDYLSLSAVLNQFLSGETVNASDLGKVYYDRAMKLLKALAEGTMNLTSIPEINVEPAAILYRVDMFGVDGTQYTADPDTGFQYRTDNVYPPFQEDMRRWYWG